MGRSGKLSAAADVFSQSFGRNLRAAQAAAAAAAAARSREDPAWAAAEVLQRAARSRQARAATARRAQEAFLRRHLRAWGAVAVACKASLPTRLAAPGNRASGHHHQQQRPPYSPIGHGRRGSAMSATSPSGSPRDTPTPLPVELHPLHPPASAAAADLFTGRMELHEMHEAHGPGMGAGTGAGTGASTGAGARRALSLDDAGTTKEAFQDVLMPGMRRLAEARRREKLQAAAVLRLQCAWRCGLARRRAQASRAARLNSDRRARQAAASALLGRIPAETADRTAAARWLNGDSLSALRAGGALAPATGRLALSRIRKPPGVMEYSRTARSPFWLAPPADEIACLRSGKRPVTGGGGGNVGSRAAVVRPVSMQRSSVRAMLG